MGQYKSKTKQKKTPFDLKNLSDHNNYHISFQLVHPRNTQLTTKQNQEVDIQVLHVQPCISNV